MITSAGQDVYLVAYGAANTLGCFVPQDRQTSYSRGAIVVVRTERGKEQGTVLAKFLPKGLPSDLRVNPGVILEAPSAVVDQSDGTIAELLFEEARQLARQLALPLNVIDLELLEEPATVVIHVLLYDNVDTTALQQSLTNRWQRRVMFHDMTNPESLEETAERGCQSCGSNGGCGGGQCESGGCSNSCGSGTSSQVRQFQHDWKSYLTEMRQVTRQQQAE